MPKRWTISDDDAALFRQQVGDVRPVKHDKIVSEDRLPSPRARFRRSDNASVLKESLDNPIDLAEFTNGDQLFFAPSNIDKRLLKRLKRGQIVIDAECDLHGLNVTNAHHVVNEFIDECRAFDAHCVRIIHGKGLRSGHRGPVIKQQLGRWLVQRADVFAFCSARPADGGTGAVYVLLRNTGRR